MENELTVATETNGLPDLAGSESPETERALTALREIQRLSEDALSKSNEIEQGRLYTLNARAEIDAALATIKTTSDSGKMLLTEIVSLQDQLRAACTQVVETKAQAAGAFESLQSLMNTANENSSRLEAIRTSAEQTQAVVATKSEHIENGRIHVDKVRVEVDRLLTEAQASATSAEAQHVASRAVSDQLTALQVAAAAAKAAVDVTSDGASKLRVQCEADALITKKLAEIATATENNIASYEARLAELEKTAAERLKTIENLLPGATSAGLASAFDKRRGNFKGPQSRWQAVFITSLVGLFVIGCWEFILLSLGDAAAQSANELSWERLAVSLLRRMPLAIPLIWLAIHAAHKAALAQRVEEDYAFKETVSRAFEGYASIPKE